MALCPCLSSAGPQGREPAEHGTALFPAACYRTRLPADPLPWHWHEELEVLWLEEGQLVLTVESGRFTLEAGSGAFLNAGVLHSAAGACRVASVVFHPRLIGSTDSVFCQKYLQPVLSSPALRCLPLDGSGPWRREVLDTAASAWDAMARGAHGYEFAVREALSRLVLILETHLPPSQAETSERENRTNARVKLMLRYIQEHSAEPLTITAIAESASVSVSECLRCFRATLGTTPIQYLKALRIQRAQRLLASTERKVSDIGTACGFREMNYFSRVFRETTGLTPGEYRRRQGKT